jgi:two-component system, NarL family, response regulator LiaR
LGRYVRTTGRWLSCPVRTRGWVDAYPWPGAGLRFRALIHGLRSAWMNLAAATPGRPQPFSAITVATVDSDPLARRALRAQLATEHDIELVGEAPYASKGVDLVKRHRPDLVLIAMTPGEPGCSEAIGEMFAASPRSRIIVLALDSDEDAQMRALRAGAAGWLLKSIDLEVLPRVLRRVQAGEAAVPRALGNRLLEETIGDGILDRNRLRPIRSSLSRREWEVIDLLVEGATTARIADQLQIRPATVRTHVKHILGKLRVHSREEAIRYVERVRQGSAEPRMSRTAQVSTTN